VLSGALNVAGTLSPNVTGTYNYIGLSEGWHVWRKAGSYYCRYMGLGNSYVLSDDLSGSPPVTPYWKAANHITEPIDVYNPQAGATGVATVAYAT